jgi:putative membrane protein
VLELIPLALTLLAAAGYGTGLVRLRRRGVRWPARRTACLAAGSLGVAAAVLPPISAYDEVFPVHVTQHLLLGMTGPAFMALSAPVTLALRALPPPPRRALLQFLHSRSAVILSAPATAVILDLGGLYALYLTGLYHASEDNDLVHAVIHLHMFLAGCLLSWVIIGIDPVHRRLDVKTRLAVLVIAGAGHDTLSKLVYARGLPVGGGSITGRHFGAELMYYGGTIIDLALAIIVTTQWYQATGRELARTARRPAIRHHPATHVGAKRPNSENGPGEGPEPDLMIFRRASRWPYAFSLSSLGRHSGFARGSQLGRPFDHQAAAVIFSGFVSYRDSLKTLPGSPEYPG